MKLVIAEKPSLGQSIIAAIGHGKFKREDGYAQSNDYIVTWSFGHLFELADMDSYFPDNGEEKKGWSLEGLPFCPSEFRYELKKAGKTKTVDPGVRKQFNTIKSLIARKDVDAIIHAGDSDREGEIIIRNILDRANNKKPVYRLWLPAQTPEDIREGLRTMKPDNQFDDLAREGSARTLVDWLFGINLTRTATVKSGTLLRVGRVVVPIVRAIYDRDMEIRNFKTVPYFAVVSEEETNGEKIKLTCKQTFKKEDRAAAQALADKLNGQKAFVADIKTEQKTISAGKLLSQSDLQALAGKKYKMTPQETLEVAQKLYENGYTSYPRTPTQYLASSEKDKINKIIQVLQDKGYKVAPKDKAKSIYDSSKVESHSAITPTHKIPASGTLSVKEQQIYDIILNRFLAVFCSEPCLVDRTTMVIRIGNMDFTLKGDVFIQRGWMKYDTTTRSDKILPKLAVGDEVNIHFIIDEKETKPPAHYTVKTLGDFLQNPFRKSKAKSVEAEADDTAEDPDDPDAPELVSEEELPDDYETYEAILGGLEIGTEATRAGIIENAIASKYISLSNNKYTILPAGEYYIETLWKMGIIMDKFKTAELGRTLKQVYRGEISIQDAVDLAMVEVKAFHDSAVATEVEKGASVNAANGVICSCPLCGGDVKEGKKGYYCSNYKTCSLNGLWKDACFVKITQKDVIALLKGSTISKQFTTKSGYKMSKKLRYDIEAGKIVEITDAPLTAGKAKAGEEAHALECPNCGGNIIERPTSFSCTNAECGFTLWKQSKYFNSTIRITEAKAKALLSGKRVLFKLISKAGKEYEGYLKLKANGKFANFEADGFPD